MVVFVDPLGTIMQIHVFPFDVAVMMNCVSAHLDVTFNKVNKGQAWGFGRLGH